jgi:hypothetical protein
MPFEYYDVEDEIVAQLGEYSSLFDAVPMPEDEADYDDAIPKPRVTIAVGESKNMGLRSTDAIIYEEEITVDCLIQSRLNRGSSGCHHIAKLLKGKLNGYKVANSNMLMFATYQKNDPFRDAQNRIFQWVLSFTFRKMQVQEVDNSETPGPNLLKVDFIDAVQLPD